jgi:beta-1,4-mannosyltransferase
MLTGVLLLLFTAVIPLLCVSSFLYLAWRNPQSLFAPARRKTAAVLVLGDVGRSPRMMYHTESLAKLGWETSLIGYRGKRWSGVLFFDYSTISQMVHDFAGSTPLASLMTLPHVHLAYLPDPPFVVRKLPFVLAAPVKIAWQSISVLALLLSIRGEVLLVQVCR